MLKNLSRGFSRVVKQLRGRGRLTEENIAGALADLRAAMLEADAALPVAEQFLAAVKEQSAGLHIGRHMNPGQEFTRIVHHQLSELMGGDSAELILKKSPAVVLACGTQGVGKTTNLAKIAKTLKAGRKKRAALASVDIRRPAALRQLKILADSAAVDYIDSDETQNVAARAADILQSARRQLTDTLLLDTGGRLAVDEEMMNEIRQLAAAVSPSEILFFVDAMQGQSAVHAAKTFHDALNITGIVLTKFDGDARGGAALSAKFVTGAPVKFVGVGEKLDDLQPFHPSRFASRILGMGDLAGLAEQTAGDLGAVKTMEQSIKNAGGFDLNAQLAQMRQMKKMGGLSALADKLPSDLADKFAGADDGGAAMKKMEAIICAMTPGERGAPDIIKASRKRRIAKGAGVEVSMVNQLLSRHEQTRKMMRKFSKNPGGMMRMLRGLR